MTSADCSNVYERILIIGGENASPYFIHEAFLAGLGFAFTGSVFSYIHENEKNKFIFGYLLSGKRKVQTENILWSADSLEKFSQLKVLCLGYCPKSFSHYLLRELSFLGNEVYVISPNVGHKSQYYQTLSSVGELIYI